MSILPRPRRQLLWGVLTVAILVILGTWWFSSRPHRAKEVQSREAMSQTEKPSESQEPAVASGEPKQPNEPAQAYAMVPAGRQQLMGVTTAVVEKRPLETTVRAVGRVEYNEQRITHVNLRISGWVDQLFVDYTGQLVRRGEPLFTLYSPDLVASQDEFLLALRTREKVKDSPLTDVREQAERLLEASRDRLRLWTLTDEQIDEVARHEKAKTYLPIASPVTGYVIEKQVFNGMFVQPETRLYSIADLSVVWMNAEIYEFEVPFVKVGQLVAASFSAYPGETFHGRVSYIYPYLNQEARTVKVRVELPNPKLLLKPEMYGTAEIKVNRGVQLTLPEAALLDSGTRKLVFVVRGEGLFEPREVKVGPKIGAYYEILEGVQRGERVVTSGNFLIDSESKLMAATNMMGSLGMAGIKMEQAQMGKMEEMGGRKMEGTPTPTKEQPSKQEKVVDEVGVVLMTDPTPPRVGDNRIRVQVNTGTRKEQPTAVSLTSTMPMPDMMPATVRMKPAAEADWFEASVNLGMAGKWDLTVTIQRRGQPEVKAEFSVMVGGGGMSGMPGMK
jgi:Cu(I)/Ag(I) efflux system membrane fusion protein